MPFNLVSHTLPPNKDLVEKILLPAAKFFMGSPLYPLNNLPSFSGAGVYALFISDNAETIYQGTSTDHYPIYVGKAVPSGSRQGRSKLSNSQLRTRLNEHRRSINQGGLPVNSFNCRFLVMPGINEDLIAALESTLIRIFHPLWNSYIDGFGIHTPGAGRFNQQPSEWDTIHSGRPWLSKLTGQPRDKALILKKIQNYSMRPMDEIS